MSDVLNVYNNSGNYATLQEIINLQKIADRVRLRVRGDCLEGLNIPDGGYVAVDFKHFPRPNSKESHIADACLCYAELPHDPYPRPCFKEYIGVWGNKQVVTTHFKYKKGEPFVPNCALFADAIFGVIYAAWDSDGKLLWKNDPEIYPVKLHTDSTIKGDNVGLPMDIKKHRNKLKVEVKKREQ